MSTETHESLLEEVLDKAIERNRSLYPGSPMADLKAAIETVLGNLPPLEFQEFQEAIGDNDAAARLVRSAPDMIGWDADQLVEWIERISHNLDSSG